jgi:hypothetical protein
MKPNITIPAAGNRGRYSFLTDPKVLQALIASLPLERRLRRLHEGAAGLAWADLGRLQRMSLLSLYRYAIDRIRPEARRFLVGLSLPLPGPALRMADAYTKVYAALADGYKRVILELASNSAHDDDTLRDVTRACYWAMYCLGERLRFSYEGYHQVPEGLWREIHQIYRYARHCEVGEAALTMDNNDGTRTSEHMYKRLVLLGLSDPYHLPFRTVPAVYHALDHWALRASLFDNQLPGSYDCQFVVTAELDRPALPGLPRARVDANASQLVLDTTELVSHLQGKRDDVIGETLNSPDNEQIRFSRFEKMETLQALIRRWGQHPLRVAPRNPTNRECELVVGLQSIHELFNGEEPNPVIRTKADTPATDVRSDVGGHGSVGTRGGPLQWTRNWALADESVEGIRLALRDKDRIPIRVGELVAFRSPPMPDWTIGEIRWAQTTGPDKLFIGVFKFGGDASAVTLKPIGIGDDTVHAGLLFEQRIAGVKQFSLVADRDLYRPKMKYRVYSLEHERLLRSGRVTISSRCFIWFEADVSRARPQDTMELLLPQSMALSN